MKKLIEKNVSMEELKSFVLSQPDDRIIDVDFSSPECVGCPLVHYTRNKLKRKVQRAGFHTTETDRHLVRFEHTVTDFMLDLIRDGAMSYKRAKKIIQKYN